MHDKLQFLPVPNHHIKIAVDITGNTCKRSSWYVPVKYTDSNRQIFTDIDSTLAEIGSVN